MRACTSCGERNHPGARFCSRCGTALGNACVHCGTVLSPEARFCSSCGNPAIAAKVTVAANEMLKLVTIMFADVVGSTRRAETMHPEDTRALMTDFFRAMTEEIEQEGGTVEQIMGDGVMAVFGAPTAHEDDPLRAVRAARAMLQRLERWNAGRDPSHQIEIRVGINTGEVSAAGEPGQGLPVTGDPVNVAARLEQSAEPGTILLGARTARAVSRAFRLNQLQPLALKGKSTPIDCFVVEDILEEPDGDRGWAQAPLVGRELELGTLLDAHERCRSTGSPHLMTIFGEAGVGKSRLVKEFVHELGDGAKVLIGRCIPYGAGVTLWPLREILKTLCGIGDDEEVRNAIGSIERLVEQTGAAESGDIKRTAAALASTIGLEGAERSTLDPRSRHREMLGAWRCLLSSLARTHPVVMIIQDIHWADDLMLDVLDDLVTRTSGALQIVCPTRPDVLKLRPSWGAGVPNSMTIQLRPLSVQESARLIDALVGPLPTTIKDVVMTRCEGNPFFVQEVLRQLVDEGVLQSAGSASEGEVLEVEIPDNVQGVLLARLDLLSPEERAVAQRAAVIGRTFWQGALEEVAGAPGLSETLRELERRNFITELPSSSIAEETEFAFTHALIKDVAYQTMPRRLRGETHEAVAQWIERTSGERVHELAELLAHHLDTAYELTPTEDIRLRARAFNLTSSRNALQRFAVRQAEVLGRRAIELSRPGLERLETLETFGDVSVVAYAIENAWWAYKQAATEARELGDASLVAKLAAKAAFTATRYEGAMKDLPPVDDVEEMIDLGLAHVGDRDDRSRCLLLASAAFSFRVSRSKAAALEATPKQALELAERLNDPELLSVALDAAAFWVAPEARYGEMYRLQSRRVGLVPQLRDVTEACDSLGSACWASYLAGHYRETIHFAEECLKRAEGVDAGNYQHALQWRLVARFVTGEWSAALEDQALLESMVDAADDSIPLFLGTAYSQVFLCHELRGERDQARKYLIRLTALKAEIGEDIGLPRAPTALALLHQGRIEEARSWLTLEEMSMSVGPILEAMCSLAPEEEDDEAAWSLAGLVRNDLKRMESPSLQGHLHRLEGRLLAAAGRSEECALSLQNSAERFASLGAPWEEAFSRLLLGELHLATGRKAEAESELRSSLDTFARLGSVTELDRSTEALARV